MGTWIVPVGYMHQVENLEYPSVPVFAAVGSLALSFEGLASCWTNLLAYVRTPG